MEIYVCRFMFAVPRDGYAEGRKHLEYAKVHMALITGWPLNVSTFGDHHTSALRSLWETIKRTESHHGFDHEIWPRQKYSGFQDIKD